MASDGNTSTSSEAYNTEEKRECREMLIKHAVECLTKERGTSTCVQRDHVGVAWKKFEQSGGARIEFKDKEVGLIEREIKEWELFYDSRTEKKKPSDLRVCYLAGENPTNDLNVFLDNGILCQNIWAIEKDKEALKKGWKSVMKSTTRNIRLFKGDFLACMKEHEDQFDIIYFDGTGPLPSSQGTLKAIGYVFLYNKLASPGALITTFSFPPKDTVQQKMKNEKEKLTELDKGYLKFRLMNTIKPPSNIESFLDSRSDEENYSDYISYQVIDTAYMYIPALRMLSSSSQNRKSLWEQMFSQKQRFIGNAEKDRNGDELSQNFLLQLHSHLTKIKENGNTFCNTGSMKFSQKQKSRK